MTPYEFTKEWEDEFRPKKPVDNPNTIQGEDDEIIFNILNEPSDESFADCAIRVIKELKSEIALLKSQKEQVSGVRFDRTDMKAAIMAGYGANVMGASLEEALNWLNEYSPPSQLKNED